MKRKKKSTEQKKTILFIPFVWKLIQKNNERQEEIILKKIAQQQHLH